MSHPLKTVLEWFLEDNTFFLFGAGCSKCAAFPLIEELTSEVSGKLDADTKALLENLHGTNARSATVEDLINHLLQKQKLQKSQKVASKGDSWTPDKLETSINNVKKAIVEVIGTRGRNHSPHHSKLFRRLAGKSSRRVIDLFTLNYDTLIEASLESEKLPYTDGFIGSDGAYFCPDSFDWHPKSQNVFRIFKLHGSVNWTRDEDLTVRRRPHPNQNGDNHAGTQVVYPAEQKYVDTQYGVYECLFRMFKDRMHKPVRNNNLIVMGYSFNDEHVNMCIIDRLRISENLTMYAFVGPESNPDEQVERIRSLASDVRERFNVWVGDTAFVGNALSEVEFSKIKDKQLWKFENLVESIAGSEE